LLALLARSGGGGGSESDELVAETEVFLGGRNELLGGRLELVVAGVENQFGGEASLASRAGGLDGFLSWSFIALDENFFLLLENGSLGTGSGTGGGGSQDWTESWARRKGSSDDFLLGWGLRLLGSGRLKVDDIRRLSVKVDDQLIENGSS
jgi:hypothetical protein